MRENIREETKEGVLLRKAKTLKRTTLEDVRALVSYRGKRHTFAKMDAAIAEEVMSRHERCRYSGPVPV